MNLVISIAYKNSYRQSGEGMNIIDNPQLSISVSCRLRLESSAQTTSTRQLSHCPSPLPATHALWHLVLAHQPHQVGRLGQLFLWEAAEQ